MPLGGCCSLCCAADGKNIARSKHKLCVCFWNGDRGPFWVKWEPRYPCQPLTLTLHHRPFRARTANSTRRPQQRPLADWQPRANAADPAILDRLVHNAHRLELVGECFRRVRPSRQKIAEESLTRRQPKRQLSKRQRARTSVIIPVQVARHAGMALWSESARWMPSLLRMG